MPATSTATSSAAAPRKPARWLDRLAVIVLLIVALGYFVIWPTATRIGTGINAILSTIGEQLTHVMAAAHSDACRRIEHGSETRAIFGQPVECAPLEAVEWLPGSDSLLEFSFAIEGPQGSGHAHVWARPAETRMELVRIVVTSPDGSVIDLLAP